MITNELYHRLRRESSGNIDFIEVSYRGQPREASTKWQSRDVVSGDGRKFCRFFGLDKVCESGHNSTIYEVTVLPPRFRVTTPSTRRLEAAYTERQ